MPACNTTLEEAYIVEDPLFGKYWTWHRLGLWISAGFGALSVLISLLLILLHATHYSKPWEQRHIIRILLMIPIYSTVSFLSYKYYRHAIYFEVLRDCYEAFAISAFFTLLCHYIAPTLHEQKEYFRQIKAKNWFWGVFGLQYLTGGKNKGIFRIPKSGLTWFNVVWIGIFQYCIIRVLCTIASVVTQYFKVYCEASISPAFAHVWIMVIEAISVTIAMFCLIQFYIQLKTELAPYKPFLKVLCIKLVIFFSFWQTLVISFLSSSKGPLQPSKTLAYADIKIGIPSTLLCVEMAIFAVMHIFAFPWQSYRVNSGDGLKENATSVPLSPMYGPEGMQSPVGRYYGGPLGLYALFEAFNPWDIVKATARGFRWLFIGSRKRQEDRSYDAHRESIPKSNIIKSISPPIPGYGQVSQVDGPSIPPAGRPGLVENSMRYSNDRVALLGTQNAVPPAASFEEASDATYSNRPSHDDRNFHDGDLGQARFPAYDDPRWHTAMPQATQFGGYDPGQHNPYRSSTTSAADHFPAPPYNPGMDNAPGIGIAVTGDGRQQAQHPGGSVRSGRSPRPPVLIDPAKQAQREQKRRDQFEAQAAASSRPTSRARDRSRSRSRSRPRQAAGRGVAGREEEERREAERELERVRQRIQTRDDAARAGHNPTLRY